MFAHTRGRGVVIRLVVLLAGVLALSACSPGVPAAPSSANAPATKPIATEAGQPTRGGTLRVGLWQEPDNLNRYFSTQTVNRIVVFTVVEGLARGGPEGSYIPVLAEELPTIQNGGVSADGRTVT